MKCLSATSGKQGHRLPESKKGLSIRRAGNASPAEGASPPREDRGDPIYGGQETAPAAFDGQKAPARAPKACEKRPIPVRSSRRSSRKSKTRFRSGRIKRSRRSEIGHHVMERLKALIRCLRPVRLGLPRVQGRDGVKPRALENPCSRKHSSLRLR